MRIQAKAKKPRNPMYLEMRAMGKRVVANKKAYNRKKMRKVSI